MQQIGASLVVPPAWNCVHAECQMRGSNYLPIFAPVPILSYLACTLPTIPYSRRITSSVSSFHDTWTETLDFFDCGASIVHTDLYGLIASLAPSTAPTMTLLTDHHNILLTLGLDVHGPFLPHSWSSLHARHLYRWLLDITSSSSTEYKLGFTHAHIPVMSADTYTNDVTDHLASEAQARVRPLPAPIPTFAYDPFFL